MYKCITGVNSDIDFFLKCCFQISSLLCNTSNVNQQNEMSTGGNFSLDLAWLLELKKDMIMATRKSFDIS